MISKELLSEVLSREVYDVEIYQEPNELRITADFDGFRNRFFMNIHELAHKCKEWAVNEMGYAWVIMNFYLKVLNLETGEVKEFRYDKEDMLKQIPHLPKYEILACQWILDNK